MADTLTFKKQLTGHSHNRMQIVTDGTDIFWEGSSNIASIYKYTIATDTVSKIADASNFDIDNGNVFGTNFTLMVFAENIYVGIWIDGNASVGEAPGDTVAKVYRVTPSGGVSTVISSFPFTTNAANMDLRGEIFRLQSTEDYIVATWIEWPTPGAATAEFKSQWSIDGTTWGNTTDSFSETIDIDGGISGHAIGKDYRTLGIHDRFPTSSVNSVILKFVDGTWSKVAGPSPNATFPLYEVGPVHFWVDTDFSDYTDDFVTYHNPGSENDSTLTLNMPFALGNNTGTGNDERFLKLDTDNPPTATITDSDMATDGVATGAHTDVHIRTNDGKGWLVVRAFGATFPDWSIWERDTNLGATPGGWGGGGKQSEAPDSNRPCDVDADGTFLYIGIITLFNTPALLKQETSLTSDATKVFDPGSGTDIGVQCGRFDTDVVWIAGSFAGTDVVEKTEDAGDNFEVKDPGTFGAVTGFIVGPDSDNRIMIADDNDTIQETIDNGDSWTAINSTPGFNTNAIGRLEINIEETVFGNDSGATDNIDYSVNSGVDMEDFSTGFPTEDVTKVIVN